MERPCKFFCRSFQWFFCGGRSCPQHMLQACPLLTPLYVQMWPEGTILQKILEGGGVLLAGFATSKSFVATKHIFCCNKSMLLSQQTYFVTTNIILWRQKFYRNKRHVCCDKSMFVTTRLCLLQQIFIMTNILLRQAYFCPDKRCVLLWQNLSCDKNDTCGSSHRW